MQNNKALPEIIENDEYDDEYDRSANDVNVKIIAILIASVVIILTLIFFIKTYADKKQSVLFDMYEEADRIEKTLDEDLNQTSYVLDLLGNEVRKNPKNYQHIYEILKSHKTHPNIANVFGLTFFAWIDADFNMRINTLGGILSTPASQKLKAHSIMAAQTPNKVIYGPEDGPKVFGSLLKKDLIPAVYGVSDNGEFLGYLMVGVDTNTIIKRLNDKKKYNYTNFAIIDHRLRVVFKSQPIISKVGIRDKFLISHNLTNMIKKINFHSETPREFSYLDMFSGLNYYVRKMKNQPFTILINIDHDEIKNNIFNKVLIKFIEISVFSSFFLILIISIYKRETWLREQAEKASEIAIKATEAKTDFLAYTAHELRSPLGFILTGSEIMKKKMFGNVPDAYMEYVNGIHQNAQLILDFINDILDESHIAEGNFKIENSIVDLTDLIDKAVTTNRTRFNDRKIKIITKIAPNLPKVICDERRMLQALNNLLSNAIKYSHDNTCITISAFIEKEEYCLRVADQGVGMTEEEIQIAFTKFGTVRKKNFNIIQSYGLGLPIVKKLIEAHEARLEIKSTVNVGTEITIVLPKYKLVYSNKVDNN